MAELSPAPTSQTASTSATLWAQPSREWVIPAKPKPGRKPKKETAAAPKHDPDEVSSGSRRIQNRAAQRAFRERKQTQLAELQARLQSYEQGEIERNVALQNIAKKMKEENDELRNENQLLREKIAWLEQERNEFSDKNKKRAYDDASPSSPSLPLSNSSMTKRARVDEDKLEVLPPSFVSLPPSSSPLVSSSGDIAFAGEISPESHPYFPTLSRLTAITLDGQDIMEPFNCILCSPDAPCVCRQATVEPVATNDNSLSSLHQLPQSEDLAQQSILPLDQSMHFNSPPIATVGALDDLPAFQAPVPIRRRTGTTRTNPVFLVSPLHTNSSQIPKCSGDPDNCIACADDNFGKAFCQAIGHTLNSTLPCVDCPKRACQTDEILVGGCCGNISKCDSCGIAPIMSSATPSRQPETIPTDDAWRQLKSHPNVAFADLALLAEVVARRSKCTGSRVVISPALGSATPDQITSLRESIPVKEGPVILTDSHEYYPKNQSGRESPPQLVPQHVLIECGRRKMREVNPDGVREALRLLDQKFAHTR